MVRPGRRFGVVGLVLLLALAVPVAAHGNYLAADTQVTADGTVRIEGVFMITEGWVVIHTDADGETGDVLGHAAPKQNAFLTNVTVPLNTSYWSGVSGTTSLWAILHYDADNDREFDASADPPIGGRDDPDHAVRLRVSKGDRPAFVLAEREHAQETNASAVDVRRVSLPEDGYLVIRTNANGSPGEVVGHRSLAAGSHDAVTVPLDDHFYHHQPEEFALWAVIYRADGDGEFDEGDEPVAVNGSMVASRFAVIRTDELDAGHTHTPTATGTAQRTATATPTHEHEHTHEAEAQATHTTSLQPTPTTRTPTHTGTPTRSPGQPGMGFLAAVSALIASLAIRRRALE